MKNKILNISIILILFTFLFVAMKPVYVNANEAKVEVINGKVVLNTGFNSEDEAFSHVIEKYKVIITFFAAIGAITMVGIFIYTFIKLGATAGNPQERQKCITGLIITGLATALLGSIALFVGLFYNAFRDNKTNEPNTNNGMNYITEVFSNDLEQSDKYIFEQNEKTLVLDIDIPNLSLTYYPYEEKI